MLEVEVEEVVAQLVVKVAIEVETEGLLLVESVVLLLLVEVEVEVEVMQTAEEIELVEYLLSDINAENIQ